MQLQAKMQVAHRANAKAFGNVAPRARSSRSCVVRAHQQQDQAVVSTAGAPVSKRTLLSAAAAAAAAASLAKPG